MSPILFTALIIGLPTIEGKIWAGKLLPAYPHLTNYKIFVLKLVWKLKYTTYASAIITYNNFST